MCIGDIVDSILVFVCMMMRTVINNPEFWDTLQRGEVQHEDIVYSASSSNMYFVVHLKYPDIVTLKNWLGSDVTTEDSSEQDVRRQLFEKLATVDHLTDANTITILLSGGIYGKIFMVFSPHPDDEDAFTIHFTTETM